MMWCVEVLTLRLWLVSLLPRLLWMRLRRRGTVSRCVVLEGSQASLVLARWCAQWLGTSVERLRFRLIEVRDAQGLLLRLRIHYQDLGEVQQDILADPLCRRALDGTNEQDRFPGYVAKALAVMNLGDRRSLCRALLSIQIWGWHLRTSGGAGTPACYFLERRPWFRVIARYAARHGITVRAVPSTLDLRGWRIRLLSPSLKRILYRLQAHGMLGGQRVPARHWVRAPSGTSAGRVGSAAGRPKLAVEYYGHLNLDRPACYSDLFFWRPSGIPAHDVVMTFNLERQPLDHDKVLHLQTHGIRAVAMRPRTVATPEAQLFLPRLRGTDRTERWSLSRLPKGPEGRWLRDRRRTYAGEERAFWAEFFEAEQVKLSTAWFKYSETHVAMADALKAVGGVSTVYQRAYDLQPCAETAVMADVVFAFSPWAADMERRSHSRVAYLAVTGYLGDYRFPLLRHHAMALRSRLQERGARRILSFSDENSHDEERWALGHTLTRQNHAFLLEKVLTEPWLGLIIKPKTPSTLRRRLGPVADLLRRAEATGRCLVFEEGAVQGSSPPAAAALASDVMIHGHLCAATAGVESALAGVPTLLFDGEGWSVSPCYRLGAGRVVFTDWSAIWKACVEHWERPAGVPGFGDWSPMLDDLDPFHDGRAAERMGTYLRWLLEGFQAGRGRETVMAEAAQRYADRWGRDKIASINGDAPGAVRRPASSSMPAEEIAGVAI